MHVRTQTYTQQEGHTYLHFTVEYDRCFFLGGGVYDEADE